MYVNNKLLIFYRPMELFLNTIFFISLPCLIMYDVIKHCLSKFSSKSEKTCVLPHQINTNKCYSTHDMQVTILQYEYLLDS